MLVTVTQNLHIDYMENYLLVKPLNWNTYIDIPDVDEQNIAHETKLN